jgi:ER-derived vesicles protein
MATSRGHASYGMGVGPQFGSPSEPQSESTLDAIREQTSKIEDMLNTLSEPIKPYVFVAVALFWDAWTPRPGTLEAGTA